MMPSWTAVSVLAVASVSYSLCPNPELVAVNREGRDVVTHRNRCKVTVEEPLASGIPENSLELLF